MATKKYEFPSRGFHIVANKVGEADYFLNQLKDVQGDYDKFSYVLSAFVSASRSITFSLQAVMSKYPGFDEWYLPHQESLKNNKLAKYFLELRNYLQKVGEVPVGHTGTMKNGEIRHFSFFIDIESIKDTPDGEVTRLAKEYFVDILRIIEACYKDYRVYVDPRVIFTTEGMSELGWSIEDIEECVGLPRGYTDIEWEGDDKEYQRLETLRREYQGDELMEQYFEKYEFYNTANK